MREALARSDRDFVIDGEAEGPSRARLVLRLLLERPIETLGSLVMAGVAGVILVNALFWQQGQHPAPLFRAGAGSTATEAPMLPPARAERPRPEPDALVRMIQAELAERGHDIGAIDGLIGPKTDAAIRAYQMRAGLDPDGVPSAALLERIKADRSRPAGDPIAKLIATGAPPPDARLIAVERTLARFGYGPVKIDGVMDDDTRAAIERFERDRGLPPTGTVSQKLMRELAAVSGAPIE